MAERFRIRPLSPADAPALGELERACFADPWTDSSLLEALGSPLCVAMGAERRGRVVGYVMGREVGGSGEILNLAVAPGERRAGIGRALLGAGLEGLRARGAREVFLEVRESNLAAQALYQREGFRPVGIRPKYYRRPVEDAVVLRLALEVSA